MGDYRSGFVAVVTRLAEAYGADVAHHLADLRDVPDARIHYVFGQLRASVVQVAEAHKGCRRRETCDMCRAIRLALGTIAAYEQLSDPATGDAR